MKLQNKVAFITDADSNSGQSIIKRLAAEGTQFILNSVSDGKALQAQLEALKQQGTNALIINIDLCSSEAVNTMLEEMAEQIGTVDILIHNNNLIKPASVETCEEDLFLEILNTNAKTAFVCTQEVGRHMAKKKHGKVVYVNSIHAEKPTGSSFAYSASKAAVKMLSKEAALNLGRDGINVNSIEMGPIEGDDEVFGGGTSSLYDYYQYKVPSTKLGTDDDLANVVTFLCSDDARYMNGADIRLDGGFLLHYMDAKINVPEWS